MAEVGSISPRATGADSSSEPSQSGMMRTRSQTLSGNTVTATALDEGTVSSMRRVFDIFDDDNSGTIDSSEIMSKLIQLNLLKSRRVNSAIMKIVDSDGDGEMDFTEFSELLGRVKVDDGSEYSEKQLTDEQKAQRNLEQEALAAFQRAVAILAFQQMSGAAAACSDYQC